MIYLARDEVTNLMTFAECVRLCEEGLIAQARGEAVCPPRFRFTLGSRNVPGHGTFDVPLIFMAATSATEGMTCLRVFGGWPARFLHLLWDRDGKPVALMEARPIQVYRTGAVAAIGTKYLSRASSCRVAVLGSGTMARAALSAHTVVRPLTHCRVFSPNKEHREAFAKELGYQLRLSIEPVDSAEAAVKDADIIITATSVHGYDQGPALRGAWLRPGVHISAIGAEAELDDEVVTRASRIVVDDEAEVQQEVKDITVQAERGLISWDQVDDLPRIVSGMRPVRQSPDEITLLKTRGNAIQDLFPAVEVYKRALETGVGSDLGNLFEPETPLGR